MKILQYLNFLMMSWNIRNSRFVRSWPPERPITFVFLFVSILDISFCNWNIKFFNWLFYSVLHRTPEISKTLIFFYFLKIKMIKLHFIFLSNGWFRSSFIKIFFNSKVLKPSTKLKPVISGLDLGWWWV